MRAGSGVGPLHGQGMRGEGLQVEWEGGQSVSMSRPSILATILERMPGKKERKTEGTPVKTYMQLPQRRGFPSITYTSH